jgi:hypothetical protein
MTCLRTGSRYQTIFDIQEIMHCLRCGIELHRSDIMRFKKTEL